MNKRTPAKNQIRNLLLLICSAVCAAFLMVGFALYYYGPTGQYVVYSSLLSPDIITKLSYSDINTKTGNSAQYIFDSIDFSYFDPEEKQWKHIDIPVERYREFYKVIANDKSILKETKQIEVLMNKERALAALTLSARTENHADWVDEKQTFQQVQFQNHGDYYRIQLRVEKAPAKWVYFYHPGIFQEAVTRLTAKSSP